MRPVVAVALALALVGCGRAEGGDGIDAAATFDAPTSSMLPDAPAALPIDATACTTVDSCGPTCQRCITTGDRQVATCNGVACGQACKGDAPVCSDNSCSRLLWNFEDQQVGGILPRAPQGVRLAVRNLGPDSALAIDSAALTNNEVSFIIPVCLGGNVDLTRRTFSFRVNFQGGNTSGEQYYVQSSMPSPMTGAFLTQRGVQAGGWVNYTAAINLSSSAATATTLTVQAGTFGAAFSGTIWFDDLKIE